MSFILWVQQIDLDKSKLAKPKAFFSAALTLDELGRWFSRHRWAEGIPLLWFGTEAGLPIITPPPSEHANVPWRVALAYYSHPRMVLAPNGSLPGLPFYSLRESSLGETLSLRMHALTACAEHLAGELKAPTWELFADASEGLLVAGIAAAHGGWGVALSASPPRAVAVSAASRAGASMTVRASDVKDPRFLREPDAPIRSVVPR